MRKKAQKPLRWEFGGEWTLYYSAEVKLKIMNILREVGSIAIKALDWVEEITNEYSDTIALFLMAGGSLLASVAIGELPGNI